MLGLCVEEHAEAGFFVPRAQHSGTQHTRWCSANSRCIHMYKLTQAPKRALALLALNACQEVWRGIIDERRVPGCSLFGISQAPVVLMPPLLNLICRIRTGTGQGQSGHARWGSRRQENSCPVRAEARDTGKDRATATARHDTERPNTDAVQGGLARMRQEEGRTRQWPAAGGFGGGEHAAAAPRGRGRQNGAQTLKKEDLCVRVGERVGVDVGARAYVYACVGVYTHARTRVPGTVTLQGTATVCCGHRDECKHHTMPTNTERARERAGSRRTQTRDTPSPGEGGSQQARGRTKTPPLRALCTRLHARPAVGANLAI